MKTVLVLLLVSLLLANSSCHPHRQGARGFGTSRYPYFDFFRRLYAMYEEILRRIDMGGQTGNQTSNHTTPPPMTTSPPQMMTCEQADFECVGIGECENMLDLRPGYSCPPTQVCCDD